MDRIFVYLVKLPDGIDEAVSPCLEGYTIYIDERLTNEMMIMAYDHAMFHIDNGDCYNETLTASQKEIRAHARRKEMIDRCAL